MSKFVLITSLFVTLLFVGCSADPADINLSCPTPEAGAAQETPDAASPVKDSGTVPEAEAGPVNPLGTPCPGGALSICVDALPPLDQGTGLPHRCFADHTPKVVLEGGPDMFQKCTFSCLLSGSLYAPYESACVIKYHGECFPFSATETICVPRLKKP